MHWLAIHLPRLPLEIFSRAASDAAPLAVSDAGGRRLLRCNRPALSRGVRPGLSPAAARALAADLRILARDPAAERAALEQLAAWALQFSSRVSLEPAGLLLEAAGSGRLFGGERALQRKVAAGLELLGYRAQLALAPTPLGASLLAAARHPAPVADAEALRTALARLPLAALVPEPRSLALLQGLGLNRIGDLLRLPRAGLARRLGPALPACLDRALGRIPDPRPDYRPPTRFAARLALRFPVAGCYWSWAVSLPPAVWECRLWSGAWNTNPSLPTASPWVCLSRNVTRLYCWNCCASA
jgi:protein ImuB